MVVDAVTEFYNYRKAMIDYMRAAFDEVKSEKSYRHLIVMMLYTQFLMYESARSAVRELVEFEPNREESLINILCCELSVYKFLRTAPDFREPITQKPDYRAERLELRAATYAEEVPKIYSNARSHDDNEKWQRAYTTAPELKSRYEEVFGDWRSIESD
jgi:hypothetical protein